MDADWFSPGDLAGKDGLPETVQGVRYKAKINSWKHRPRKGQGGGKEYHISSLPKETQAALRKQQARVARAEQLPVLHDAAQRGAEAGNAQMVSEAEEQMRKLSALNLLDPREQERVRARIEVLNTLKAYEQSFVTRDEAIRHFVTAYNRGEILHDGPVSQFVPKLSRTTLLRWRSAMALHGAAGLSSNYRATKTSIIDSQAELLDFAEGFLAKLPHSHAKNLQLAIKAHFDGRDDITLPGYSAIQKWMVRWKVTNRRVFMAVANPDKFKNTYQIALGSRSESVVRLNQMWEMDSSPSDLMCTDGRFSLIACVDVYSRRALIKVRKNSDSHGVALTLRDAILAWGMDIEPVLRVDNGRDYGSHYMALVASTLGMTLSQTDPYSGEQKPFVERFFRTFAHGMIEMCVGFSGHNVAQKKEIEAQFSFADRLKRSKGSKPVIPTSMSSADLQAFCNDWVNEFYMHNVHAGIGCTPQEKVDGWLHPIRHVADVRALDLLLAPIPGNRGMRTVQKKGIKLDGRWYLAGEMGARVGDTFLVRFDDRDIGRVYLFEEGGAFAFMAQCPEITGISRADLAAAGHEAQQAIAAEKKSLKAKARKISQQELVTGIMDKRKRENAERSGSAANNVLAMRRTEVLGNDHLDGAAAALAAGDQVAATPVEPRSESIGVFIESNRFDPQQPKKEDGKSRMRRWMRLDKQVQAGETLCDIDQSWKQRYESSPEYLANRDILDSWGTEFFEERVRQ